jgi:hypothetical protein
MQPATKKSSLALKLVYKVERRILDSAIPIVTKWVHNNARPSIPNCRAHLLNDIWNKSKDLMQ